MRRYDVRRWVRLSIVLSIGGLAGLLCSAAPALAQPAGAAQEDAPAPEQAVIEREPLVVRDPETFRVTMSLKPIKSIEVAARVDGVVKGLQVQPGQKIPAQSEVIRLESEEQRLILEQAKAMLRAAQARATSQEDVVAKAEAEAAKLQVDLAQHRFDQSIIRAPFDATVQRVHVVEGQYVRAGDPLVSLADLTKLTVEVPINRKETETGEAIPLRIEGISADPTIEQVLPLAPQFEPLRDLFESVATGVAILDNQTNQWQAGQTVYSPLVPRNPVAEVPNAAVNNDDEGERHVQVLRDGFVRNVLVDVLGPIGEDRTYVTGRFGPGDELIVESSHELVDGAQLIPATAAVQSQPTENAAGGNRPAQRSRTGGPSF